MSERRQTVQERAAKDEEKDGEQERIQILLEEADEAAEQVAVGKTVALREVKRVLSADVSGLVVIEGRAGSGKTFLARQASKYRYKVVLPRWKLPNV